MYHDLLLYKIFIPSLLALLIGFLITPFLSRWFYRKKMWKKKAITESSQVLNGKEIQMSEEFKKIHNEKEVSTPRVGGIIVWGTVTLTILFMYLLGLILKDTRFSRYFFTVITRNQTLIPFMSLILGAIVGLIDDYLQISTRWKKYLNVGIPRRIRVLFVIFLGAIEGIWFYEKLGFHQLSVPFADIAIPLGAGFILFYIIVMMGLFSSAVIDGIDGLAAGVFAIIFGAYGIIGIVQNQWSIASFSFIVMAALLVFLWFNIPPARFYLGETGILALTLSLSSIIFLTHTVFEFLIIGSILVATSVSTFAQIIARRYFGKKIFRVAPLHHHFEALGWSRPKVVMRYWVFTLFSTFLGIVLVILKNMPLHHF